MKKLGKNFETKLTFTVTNLHLDAGISHGSFLSADYREKKRDKHDWAKKKPSLLPLVTHIYLVRVRNYSGDRRDQGTLIVTLY